MDFFKAMDITGAPARSIVDAVRGAGLLGVGAGQAMGAQTMADGMSHQVAALPYRFDEGGSLEVLLITSRGGRRWIPPKGNLMKGLARHEAAKLNELGVE